MLLAQLFKGDINKEDFIWRSYNLSDFLSISQQARFFRDGLSLKRLKLCSHFLISNNICMYFLSNVRPKVIFYKE